jgi:hypothetical protein
MTEEEYKIIDLTYITNQISKDMTVPEKKEKLEQIMKKEDLENNKLYYDVVDGEITKYPCKLLNIDIFTPNNKTIFYIKPCVNNDCDSKPIRVDKIYIKKTNDVAPVAPVVAPVPVANDDEDDDFDKFLYAFPPNTTGGKPKSRRSNKKKSNKKKKTNKKRSTKRKSNKKKRKTHRRR